MIIKGTYGPASWGRLTDNFQCSMDSNVEFIARPKEPWEASVRFSVFPLDSTGSIIEDPFGEFLFGYMCCSWASGSTTSVSVHSCGHDVYSGIKYFFTLSKTYALLDHQFDWSCT